MNHGKNYIAKNIAIFKIFWLNICYKLGKHFPHTLSSIRQPWAKQRTWVNCKLITALYQNRGRGPCAV